MGVASSFWSGRRVLLTGHTGFKGAWLSLWLHKMGARVIGYARDPVTRPNLFDVLGLAGDLHVDVRGDVADLPALREVVTAHQPDVLIHMAAQSLVKAGYADPVETFSTNVMGTVHALEAARHVPAIKAVVVVTSDKCYGESETGIPYRELDPLGGRDPYSASKAGAEQVTAAFRSSFFQAGEGHARVATTRAGNVLGGGDWASDRLVPDCIRAFSEGLPVTLRNPDSVRPWQHVLDVLAGYLMLAQRLAGDDGEAMADAWNFGPDTGSGGTVRQLADAIAELWGPKAQNRVVTSSPTEHEAAVLRLDSTRARTLLGWKPNWGFQRTLSETVTWYKAWQAGDDMRAFSERQIEAYSGGHS